MAEDTAVEATEERKQFIDGKLGTFLFLDIIDWGQTLNIADNPDKYYEHNPILGDHPSRGEVNRYFVAGMITTTLIYKLLPEKYADLYIKGMIGMEVYYVGNNYHIGIRCRF